MAAGSAPAAAADAVHVELTVSRSAGAEGCPSHEELVAAVRAHLGADPFRPGAPRRLTVRFERAPRELVAHLAMSGAPEFEGVRELRTGSGGCEHLGASAALVIALAIGPLATQGPATAAGPIGGRRGRVALEAGRTRAGVASSTPSRAASPKPRPWLAVGLAGAVGLAPAPVSGGLTLGAVLDVGSWSGALEVTGYAIAPRAHGAGTLSSPAVHGTLVGCWRPGILEGCLGVTAGAFWVLGEVDGGAHRAAVLAPLVRLGARWPIGGAALRVHVDALTPLTRTRVREGDDVLWESPALAVVFGFAALFGL